MKIGILTYHSVYNFGANLQTLSTIGYLRKKGHEPIVINWRPTELTIMYNKQTPLEQCEIHEYLFRTYYPLTDVCKTKRDIAKVIENDGIEAIIIGSDAVLSCNPLWYQPIVKIKKFILYHSLPVTDFFPNPFWCNFMTFLKKSIPVAYMSASAQNTMYKSFSKSEKNMFRKLMDKVSYVAVRDRWTQSMFKEITNNKIVPTITPDPVFAFNKNVPQELYSKEIIAKFNLPDKYLLLSFKHKNSPTQEWINEFVELCAKEDITCYALPFPQSENSYGLKTVIKLPLSPLEWYALIKYSQGYVGNNMHPVIVSLHNAVPLFSFDNYGFSERDSQETDLSSSKIFDILQRSGFEENYLNIANNISGMPSPHYVFEKISKFNRERCLQLSEQKYAEYEAMMEDIEKVFTKN